MGKKGHEMGEQTPEIWVSIQPNSEPTCGGAEGPKAEGRPTAQTGAPRALRGWGQSSRPDRDCVRHRHEQAASWATMYGALRSPQTPLKIYEHGGE